MTAADRPPLPDWARTVTDHLADAGIAGRRGDITEDEQSLIHLSSLMVRARYGDTHFGEQEARELIAITLRRIATNIEAAS